MRRALLTALVASVLLPSAAHAALPSGPDWYKDPSVNADWTQQYITETGDNAVTLHADILRPKGVPATQKLPVILSIGPYFNHSGQTDPTENPAGTEAGPSTRFVDFVVGAHLMQKGYEYVMVDLRGYGASTGCSDFGGAGEQKDVHDAVEYFASRPDTTGSVGLYGKSYDAVTGLIGEVTQPKGLKAIIAQEPVYDEYNYLYTNKVKFANFAGTPAIYQQLSADPGVVGADDPTYQVNAAMSATCSPMAIGDQSGDDDPNSAFWKQHDYAVLAKGHTVPLFLTQGFLEDNTKPLGAWRFYNALNAPKHAWFGMWDHIRGNDEAEGDNKYPRFFEETSAWFDHYLKGASEADAPVDKLPANEVETNDGTWRAESAWPPVDSVDYTVPLNVGTYTDDGNNNGSGSGAGSASEGIWTFSKPMTADQRYSGVPAAKLDLTATIPMANVAIDTYDVSDKNVAILLSRSTYLLDMGENKLDFELYGNDWKIPKGHRIGIFVSSSNAEWWDYVPTMTPVVMKSGSVTIPFLKYTRPTTIPGKTTSRLPAWLSSAPFTIPMATITAGESKSFPAIPAPTAAPAGSPVTQTAFNPGMTPTSEPDTTTSTATTPPSTTTTTPAPTTDTTTATTTLPTPPSTPPSSVSPIAIAKSVKLTARVTRPETKTGKGGKRKLKVSGLAPSGSQVVVHLVRNGKVVLTKRITVKGSSYKLLFTVRRAGKYTARVSAVSTTTSQKVTAVTRKIR